MGVNYWLDFQERIERHGGMIYDPSIVPPDVLVLPSDDERDPFADTPFGDPGGKLDRQLVDRVEAGVVLIRVTSKWDQPTGHGSGFVVNEKGWVVTNYHVVRSAAKATVRYHDGTERPAQGMVAFDERGDLAILQVGSPPAGVKPLELGPIQPPSQGESVFAVGHPGGLEFSVTTGIVSAVRKTSDLPREFALRLDAPGDTLWVQTNAVLLGGSSGGPLCDQNGRVIGVNTLLVGRERFGFACHVSHVAALLANPRAQPEVLPGLRPLNDIENPLADLDPKVQALWQEFQYRYVAHQMDKRRDPKAEDPRGTFAEQLWQIANSDRRSITAVQALWLACQLYSTEQSDAVLQRALARLLEDHIENRGLHRVLRDIARLRHGAVDGFFEQVSKRSTHRHVQAAACFYRAIHLALLDRAQDNDAINGLLDRCAKEFGDVRLDAASLAEHAQAFRSVFGRVSVGKPANELTGQDVDGKPMKLADYRGRAVLLMFFTDSSPHCVLMYPHVRQLAQRYSDQPFVLLGVNCDGGDTLRNLIRDGKVTWRCWADGASGPIAKQWQVSQFPTLYLIDKQGIVRKVFNDRPEEKELDEAVEKLVQGQLGTK